MNLLHSLGQVTPICFGLERVRPVLYQLRDLSRLNREEGYWLRRLSSVRKADLGDDFIAVRDQPVDSEAPVACCRVLVVHVGKVVSSADSLLRLWPFHDELIAQDSFDGVEVVGGHQPPEFTDDSFGCVLHGGIARWWVLMPNVRAKRAPTACRAGQQAQNGPQAQRLMASAACRWRSA